MTDLPRKGLPQYSELGFGESLSKVARHELAILCLEGIRLELSRKPIPNKSRGRGRPPSPVGVLAQRMNVHPDSVRRWMDLREIQASDFNATRLAEMAYAFDPAGVEKILQEDIARRRETMDKWLKEANSKYRVSPYVVNSHPRPYGDEILPDEGGLNQHIIELHKGNLATEGRKYTQKIVGKAAPKTTSPQQEYEEIEKVD